MANVTLAKKINLLNEAIGGEADQVVPQSILDARDSFVLGAVESDKLLLRVLQQETTYVAELQSASDVIDSVKARKMPFGKINDGGFQKAVSDVYCSLAMLGAGGDGVVSELDPSHAAKGHFHHRSHPLVSFPRVSNILKDQFKYLMWGLGADIILNQIGFEEMVPYALISTVTLGYSYGEANVHDTPTICFPRHEAKKRHLSELEGLVKQCATLAPKADGYVGRLGDMIRMRPKSVAYQELFSPSESVWSPRLYLVRDFDDENSGHLH